MKIYKYDVPDDLVYRYANRKNGRISDYILHGEIMKELAGKYPEFEHYMLEKQTLYNPRGEFTPTMRRIENAQEFLEKIKGKKFAKKELDAPYKDRKATLREAIDVNRFIYELDLVVKQINETPRVADWHKKSGFDY